MKLKPYDLVTMFEIGMDRKIPGFIKRSDPGLRLNLGAGNKQIEFCEPLDLPEWDADIELMPFEDESVIEIFAFHFLEHVREPVKILQECQRVLAPGGTLNICVPYYRSQMAYQDLDHKQFYCEDTWKELFNNPYYDKNKIEWKFDIGMNIIIGVVERNLCLLTQLIKKG